MVPTFTPFIVRFVTLFTSGEALNLFTVETLPSQLFAALGSKTVVPIVTFTGTTTTGIVADVLVAAKGLVPTIVPVRAVPSLVAVIEYVDSGIVDVVNVWMAAVASVPPVHGTVRKYPLSGDDGVDESSAAAR